MHAVIKRLSLAAIVVALLAVLVPSVSALECEGVPLDGGCLFTITGGDTDDPDDGFAVTNADDVPLWDFVAERDLQAIGYPISQRWVNGPFTLQAFQKVILQWDPGKGRMNYYNTLDVLANRYPEVELPNVSRPPDPGSGSRRGLRHHHAQPPGAPRPERGHQGPLPIRARLAQPLRPPHPLRGAGGQRPSAGPADAAGAAHGVRDLERPRPRHHRRPRQPPERPGQSEAAQQRHHSRRGQGPARGSGRRRGGAGHCPTPRRGRRGAWH